MMDVLVNIKIGRISTIHVSIINNLGLMLSGISLLLLMSNHLVIEFGEL